MTEKIAWVVVLVGGLTEMPEAGGSCDEDTHRLRPAVN